MVHQHFRLVEPFTVAENVLLGDERGPGARFALHPREVEQEVAALAERYGLPVRARRAHLAALAWASSSASRS